MKVLQMQATSAAAPGEIGGGFRVEAVSTELDHATVRGLLQLFGRVAIQGFREAGAAGASPHQAPFLLHQVLPNGRALIARFVAAPTEAHQSPAWTVHCLVTADASAIFPLAPIQVFEGPDFNQQPGRGGLLPALTGLHCGPGMDLESIRQYVRQAENLERLPCVLTAFQNCLLRGGRLVLAAPPEVMATWMAVAGYLLPSRFTRQMTFITATTAPAQAGVMVAGTSGIEEGAPRAEDFPEGTSLLDFEGTHWEGPSPPTMFARLVTQAFQDGRTDPLLGFPEFAERLFPRLAVADLDAAFIYYGLASDLFPDQRDLPPLLDWLTERFSALAALGPLEAAPHLAVEQTAAEALQFRDPNVFGLLKQRAVDERRLDLLGLVNGIVACGKPHERPQLFRESLRAARDWHGDPHEQHVTTTYHWVWASTSPTAQDGVALLEQLECPPPDIVSRLCTILEREAHLGRLLPEHARLLESLGRLDPALLGDHAALVQAFAIGEELSQGPCDGRTLWVALECSRKISPRLGTALMEQAASTVVDIEEPTSQRRNVHHWWRLGGDAFLGPYCRLATSRLENSRGQVALAERLFSSWVREEADLEEEPWRTLLNECLAQGLAGWDKVEMARLDTRLESHHELGPLWVRWYKDQDHGGGGFLWRLKQKFTGN